MARQDAKGVTRRTFLAASAAAAASLALVGCQQETKVAATNPVRDADLAGDGGEWIPSVCWNNCGGMCENKVFVKDGVVVRQKTDDLGTDSHETLQLRACPRGRAHRQDSLGPDRLKYPMKRKNWEPHTGGKKELRGIDEWERISWDEAFQIIADEAAYTKKEHGDRSVLYAGVSSSFGPLSNCLNGAGIGGITVGSTMSFGTACWNFVLNGLSYLGIGESNDRTDYANSDIIVLYGANPAWASPGSYTYFFDEAKQKGAEFVFVGPEYNAGASHFDARWIRVRPGTDTAFLLAVAYDMFTEDAKKKGSVIDWDFVYKYTVGIDKNNHPKDAKVDENFKDYVLGKYDNQPKDAEWASKITGTPVEDIHYYASLMNRNNKISILRSNAPFRTNDSDNLLPLFMAIGFMGGHIGKPGHNCDCAYHNTIGSPAYPIYIVGDSGAPWGPPNPLGDLCVNDDEQWQAVLEGHFNNTGNITFGVLLPEDQQECDIHFIVFDGVGDINTQLNTNKAIEAVRSVDFVVATARAYTSQAKYADIVLPLTGEWETVGRIRAGYVANQTFYNREPFIFGRQVIKPMFETKTEQEVGMGLAKAMGLDADAMYPVSEAQQLFNQLAGTQFMEPEKGEWVTMFDITKEDIANFADGTVTGKPQKGWMPFADIMRDGIYRVPRKNGDVYTYFGYQDYLKDPEKNPRDTPSGKIEIYCQTRADALNASGRTKDGFVWKPYPTYKPPLNGYEASFVDGNIDGEKGEYPYQIFNPHYLRRSHTQFDNLPWLRYAWTNPFFVSAADAEEKGVKNGDWVRVWNQYGQVIRPVTVTQRMMPGVVALPHGPWVDIDPDTGIDHAGTDNMLTAPVSSGCGTAGYNTNLVNFEKWTGEAVPDYLQPARIPVVEGAEEA